MKILKKKKTLLAAGCSFTDPNWVSVHHPEIDCSFPRWPEIVGQKLGLHVANVSYRGIDNQSIVDYAIEYINKNQDEVHTVMIGWTEWHRINFYGHNYNSIHLADGAWNAKKEQPEASYLAKVKNDGAYIDSTFLDHWKEQGTDIVYESLHAPFARKFYVQTQYNRIMQLSLLCKGLGIKLVTYQLLNPMNLQRSLQLTDEDKDDLLHQLQLYSKEMVDAYSQNPIKTKNHIGFPYFRQAGGYHYSVDFEDRVGLHDGHPNANGQKKIAKEFLDRYKQLYG